MSLDLKYRLFILLCCFYVGVSQVYAQNIPRGITTPICDGQSISTGAPEDSEYTNIVVCVNNPPLSPYIDFYRVVIQSGSTFVFVVTPNGQADYDFGAWKNPNWEDLFFTPWEDVRGSQNEPFQTGIFHTGLSMTEEALCEDYGAAGYPEPGLVKYFDVEPGDEILIAIDRWSDTDLGYTIDFDGGDAVLDCTILGNNIYKCIDVDVTEANFDLETLTSELEEDFPNGVFKFFLFEEDAINDSGTQIEFPFSVDYNDGEATEIYVRVEDEEGNFINVVQLYLFLSKFPQLLTDNINLDPICGGDDKANIDLTQYDELLIPTEEEDIQIRYYGNEDDYQTGAFIENPTAYEVAHDQTIFAEAIDMVSGCVSEDFAKLKLSIENKPTIDLSQYDGAVICENTEDELEQELTSIEVETGLTETDYNFTWKYEGETLAETGANLLVDSGGTYSVIIANKDGLGCEEEASFTIYEYGAPQFQIKPTHPGFTEGNGIKVFNINGLGVYVFKVDDGDWQSPDANGTVIFDNISPGPHLVYGKDVGGCGELILPITLLGYPNFFTPNGDGINDTWNIIGLQDQPNAKISIFDRYGKLLTQISPGNVGWDGTFHGKNMPSNEYWFKVDFKEVFVSEDEQETKQSAVYTGHFTLKR